MSVLNVFLLLLGYGLLLVGVTGMDAGAISLLRGKPTSDAQERICSWFIRSVFPFVIVGIVGGVTGVGSMVFSAALTAGVLHILLVFGMLGLSREYKMSGNALRDLVVLLVSVVLLVLFTSYTWSSGHPASVIGRVMGAVLLVLAVVFAFWTFPFFAGKSKVAQRSPGFDMVPSAVFLVGGLALSGLGTVLFVTGTAKLAADLEIGQALFGFSIIGLGISLPEYIYTAKHVGTSRRPVAVRRTVAAGNLGLLSMVGIAALINPVTVEWGGALLLLLSMAAMVIFFVAYCHGRSVGRIKGALLLAAYAAIFILFMRFGF